MHFMDPILQSCGLGKDQETGQNLYKTHYYLEKVHDILLYFLFLIYGDEIPKDLLNAFGLFSKQRWLTQERQCLKAWRCLCIRATIKLLNVIATLYGGEHTFEYQEAMKICVCADDPVHPVLSSLFFFWFATIAAAKTVTQQRTWANWQRSTALLSIESVLPLGPISTQFTKVF